MLSLRRSIPFVRNFCSAGPEIQVNFVGANVAHVALNRPDRRNAYTLDLWKETKRVFDELSQTPKCRVIVLSGNGKSFCAGIDLQMGMGKLIETTQDDSLDVGRKARLIEPIVQACQDGFTAIEKCNKPVIAAIHSHCIGAGIDMVTACDIRFASADTQFSIKEVDIGMAADVGTLNRIGKIIGNDSWLREIAFTARNFGVDDALKYGLISRIFSSQQDCLEGALKLAEIIAEKSPIGVQGTKRALTYSRDHSVADSLEMVKVWNMSQLLSSDLTNSAMAAMSKQKATYEDV